MSELTGLLMSTSSGTLPETTPPPDRHIPGLEPQVWNSDPVAAARKASAYGKKDPKACPYCKYMKKSPCRGEFTKWDDCFEECEKNGTDPVTECRGLRARLRKCMKSYPTYRWK